VNEEVEDKVKRMKEKVQTKWTTGPNSEEELDQELIRELGVTQEQLDQMKHEKRDSERELREKQKEEMDAFKHEKEEGRHALAEDL